MKTYKTYNARNAVKAALVTNHIKAQKKLGVSPLRGKGRGLSAIQYQGGAANPAEAFQSQ